MTEVAAAFLRAELASLRARYDSGAVSPGVYAIIRQLEIELAWHEHSRRGSHDTGRV
jgi:hypothetical protein